MGCPRIVAVMLPPSLALSLFIFAGITLLLGEPKKKGNSTLVYAIYQQACWLVGRGVRLPWCRGFLWEIKHYWHSNNNMHRRRRFTFHSTGSYYWISDRLVQGIPTSLQLQKFVFQGMFLDPRFVFVRFRHHTPFIMEFRSTAVYGAFFFIGTFALGALRAFIPKLTLLSIFGSIVLDIVWFLFVESVGY